MTGPEGLKLYFVGRWEALDNVLELDNGDVLFLNVDGPWKLTRTENVPGVVPSQGVSVEEREND